MCRETNGRGVEARLNHWNGANFEAPDMRCEVVGCHQIGNVVMIDFGDMWRAICPGCIERARKSVEIALQEKFQGMA